MPPSTIGVSKWARCIACEPTKGSAKAFVVRRSTPGTSAGISTAFAVEPSGSAEFGMGIGAFAHVIVPKGSDELYSLWPGHGLSTAAPPTASKRSSANCTHAAWFARLTADCDGEARMADGEACVDDERRFPDSRSGDSCPAQSMPRALSGCRRISSRCNNLLALPIVHFCTRRKKPSPPSKSSKA